MGIAIVLIILFHSSSYIGPYPILNSLFGFGWLGVDFFLLVSGMGLCFSQWTTIKEYLCKRLLRILPTFWLVLAIFLLLDIISGTNISLLDYCIKVTTLGFWVGNHYEYWYISAIIALYVLFLWFRRFEGKKVFFLIVLLSFVMCLFLFYLEKGLDTSTNRFLFFSRIPIFLVGIYIGKALKKNAQTEVSCYFLVGGGILFLCLFLFLCKADWDFCLRSGILMIIACFFIPSIAYIMCILMEKKYLSIYRVLKFFGGITLELYLIHGLVLLYMHSNFLEVGFAFPISVLFAWILHLLSKRYQLVK